KGFVWSEVRVTGRAAHGSRPHLGVDAIVKMGPVLTALGALDEALGVRQHPLLGRGSVHASVIDGGVELSSYPAHCVLALERRTLPGERGADVERELAALLDRCRAADAELDAEQRTLLVREPFEIDQGAELVGVVRAAAADVLGQAPRIGGVSYWADAAFIAAAGIPTVLFKDESDRLGLPAFKVLGAAWAIERALREQPEAHTLVAASAGNHGRAVARVAALRGLRCRIFLPERSLPARRDAIASEGAEV